jgi:ABC-2 type transport system permease protein
MNLRAIRALVLNDLRLYATDRRAVVVGVLVPIVVAAFFGYVFSDRGGEEQGKVPIALVDEDQSAVTRAIAGHLAGDAMLAVTPLSRAAAREQVLKGRQGAAAIFPRGFGEQSVRALFGGSGKPRVELLVDPSQAMSARLVQGLLAQYAMQDITHEAFNGVMGRGAVDQALDSLGQLETTPERAELARLLQSVRRFNTLQGDAAAGRQGAGASGFQLSIPYEVAAESMVARKGAPYNSFAHSFAGMAVQFILFAGIDAGIVLSLLRQRGIWQRYRSAPLGRGEFMFARVAATTLISAFQVTVIYFAAMAVFGVRVDGSWPGFLLVAAAFCVLNASFGLMLATLGRSAPATRGFAMLVMLLLVMLGGAWVPAFVFPAWLQDVSLFSPARWAVDGLDAMTWRGLPFSQALVPALVLASSAAACFTVAVWRFRWEE